MFFSNIKNKILGMTKKQKIFAIIITAVILINIVIGIVAVSIYRTKSSLHLEIYNSTELTKLEALNSGARKGVVKGGLSASFKFSPEQKLELENIFKDNQHIGLSVRIRKVESIPVGGTDSSFQFGFLYKKDFTPKGKFIEKGYPDNSRTLVKANMKNAPDVFDISFAIKNKEAGDNSIPEGFFVYSAVPCQIEAVCIVPLELGFDVSGEVPFYGFSSNGGVIDFTNMSFDFSGAPLVFPSKTSKDSSLPEYCVKLSGNELYKSTLEDSIYSNLIFGGEKIRVNNVKPAEEVIIPTGGLKTPFSNMKIDRNEMCITAVLLRPTDSVPVNGEVLKPVVTDPGLILNYKKENWRTEDYELFEWDRYHKILFFDTKDYDVQDNFFRRMAYFVEKNGYKGKLLTNEELEGKHGYNAHDYSAISMAKFFNLAHDLNFQLNKEELLLKRILIENDLLEEDGEYVKPNEGGLVSISQESTPALRKTFLAHEGWHTIFFKDEEFRNYVSAVYWTLDPFAREWLSDYFTANPSLQYDTNDDYLINNEFMAYIMQQDLYEVANYFVSLAKRSYVREYTPELSEYIIQTHGRAFEDAAIALNDFVFDKYGIVCGNICLVQKY